jgi:hypothetical protein
LSEVNRSEVNIDSVGSSRQENRFSKHCEATEVQAHRSKMCMTEQFVLVEANYRGINQTQITVIVHP